MKLSRFPSILVRAQFTIVNNLASVTLPMGAAWDLAAVFLNWTSNGTAGSRVPAIIAKDLLGNILWEATADSTQAASLTNSYSFQSGLGFTQNVGGFHTNALPTKAMIPPGGSLSVTDLAAISTGDTIPVLTAMYEQMG